MHIIRQNMPETQGMPQQKNTWDAFQFVQCAMSGQVCGKISDSPTQFQWQGCVFPKSIVGLQWEIALQSTNSGFENVFLLTLNHRTVSYWCKTDTQFRISSYTKFFWILFRFLGMQVITGYSLSNEKGYRVLLKPFDMLWNDAKALQAVCQRVHIQKNYTNW